MWGSDKSPLPGLQMTAFPFSHGRERKLWYLFFSFFWGGYAGYADFSCCGSQAQ